MSLRKTLFIALTILLAILMMSGAAFAQPDEPLQVVTKLLPPFVMEQGDEFTGFSIQLWEAIAQELGMDYELYEVETVAEQLEAVENGEADVAVAGISITAERETVIDFTFPYFDAGLQIMTRQAPDSPVTHALAAIFSQEFLQFLLLVIVLIVISAHVLWWFERRSHPTYRQGIGQALWWSAVTVVGFDEKPPVTLAGRLMALVWMFAGIFIIANLTATLSAGATVRVLRGDINDVNDLRDHRVVAVEGTTSAHYLGLNGIGYSGVASIEQAYDMLQDGEAAAIVYDAPVLRYLLNTRDDENVQIVGQVFEPEKYGIALPAGSPLREPINQAILRLQEDGTYQQLYTRWFGTG